MTAQNMVRISLFICTLIVAAQATAFPANVRHGYVNCTSCHVSPTGGGVLTPYGRATAGELMSTWSYEEEGEPLHGALRLPEWLKVGGDYRFLQRYLNNDRVEEGESFTMQTEVAAAVTAGDLTVLATAGLGGGPDNSPDRGDFVSREHYALYTPHEAWNLRAGRFRLAYGLNQPNHSAYVRSGLGFGPGTEPYAIEVSHLADDWNFFLTGFHHRQEEPDLEKGYSVSVGRTFWETLKVNLNFYRGESDASARDILGLAAIFGWTKSFYHLLEINSQWRETFATSSRREGVVTYNKFGYEVHKGVHGLLIHQLSYLDLENVDTRRDASGLGFQWLPRPHFELSGEFYWNRNLASSFERYQTAWLVFHYYL